MKNQNNKSIKELRKEKNLTQAEASKLTGVPLRTFKNYENDASKIGTIKHDHILREIASYNAVDEDHGVLNLSKIRSTCEDVLKNYDVDYCILFGSYAKGNAGEKSDVDLIVSTKLSGLKFFGLAEHLRESLCKKVDLLDSRQLNGNVKLINAVLKEGIKIYER